MLAFSQTLDHLSVLVAAVAACVAVYFARETVTEARRDARLRQLGELIACVARMRSALAAGRLSEADEQAKVIYALAAAIPDGLPATKLLAASSTPTADPNPLSDLADPALAELRAAVEATVGPPAVGANPPR